MSGTEAGNPFDELRVQLPGRLLTVEILLTLLLRGKANVRQLLTEADSILALYEQHVHAGGQGADDGYALKVFAVARENLDTIGRNASPPQNKR